MGAVASFMLVWSGGCGGVYMVCVLWSGVGVVFGNRHYNLSDHELVLQKAWLGFARFV